MWFGGARWENKIKNKKRRSRIEQILYVIRQSVLGCFIFFAMCAFTLAQLPDKTKKIDVHIPSQQLDEALIDFSSAFNRVVVGLPDSLKGLTSNEVKGRYSAKEALAILLNGTDLEIRSIKNSGFVVRSAEKKKNISIPKEGVSSVEEVITIGLRDQREKKRYASTFNLDSDFIIDHQVDSIEDASLVVPGFFSVSGNEGTLKFNLRGLGNDGESGRTTTPVTIHYNGAYKSAWEADNLLLFDIENVVIDSEPQITARGRTSAGGSIEILPARPLLGEYQSQAEFTAGSHNLQAYSVMLNAPLHNEFAIRFAARSKKHDGYITIWDDYTRLYRDQDEAILHYPRYDQVNDTNFRRSNGRVKKLDDVDRSAWRLSGLWQINPGLTWLLQLDQHENQSSPNTYIDPYILDKYERAIVVDGFMNQDFKNDILTSRVNFRSKEYAFDYRLSFSESEFSSEFEYDFGRLGQYSEGRVLVRDQRLLSHSFELNNYKSDARASWLLGAYIEDREYIGHGEVDHYKELDDGSPLVSVGLAFLSPKEERKIRDMYAQLNYKLSANWEGFISSRYSHSSHRSIDSSVIVCSKPILRTGPDTLGGILPDNIYYSDSGVPRSSDQFCAATLVFNGHDSWQDTSYRLGISFNLDDLLTSSLSYSHGARPGVVQHITPLDSQTSDNIQWSLDFTRGNLNFDSRLFYSKHKGMHVWNPIFIDTDNDGVLDTTNDSQIQNDADATSKGLELSARYRFEFGSEVSATYSYIDATYDRYEGMDNHFSTSSNWNDPVDDPTYAALGFQDFSGNRLPQVPRNTLNLKWSHEIFSRFGVWQPSFRLGYVDKYYLDVQNRDDASVKDEFTKETHYVENFSLQESYTMLDVGLKWQSSNRPLKVMFFVNNVTDENVRIEVVDEFYSQQGFGSGYLAPRTYGVSFSFDY